MRNYGLATLMLAVGLALGTVIGLLLDRGGSADAELVATRSLLEQRETALAEAESHLEGAEAARRDAEQQLERLIEERETMEAEFNVQLQEAARRMEEAARLAEGVVTGQVDVGAAATAHIFILEELFAFAQGGFGVEFYDFGPAVEDGLAELPPEVAAEVSSVLTETDPIEAERRYWTALQRVLNSLQAATAG